MRIKIKKWLFLGCFIVVNSLTTVLAQTTGESTSGVMNVSASVMSECSMSTINPTNFPYDPSNVRPRWVLAGIDTTCTKDTAYSLRIDGGQNSDGIERYMINNNNGDKIMYRLATSSASVPINNAFTNKVGTGSKIQTLITVHFIAKQNVSAGNYIDNLIITVEY